MLEFLGRVDGDEFVAVFCQFRDRNPAALFYKSETKMKIT
jgi:hypothetical protein